VKLTDRDLHILRDLALSRVLSRDQVVKLYFGSITRANTRLRMLRGESLVSVLTTPFFSQQLYQLGVRAPLVVGEKITRLIGYRKNSPAFLQHSLAVTEVRIALLEAGGKGWLFEPQLWQAFAWGGQRFEVRPDAFLISPSGPTFLEVDLGHVATEKFRQKLLAYRAFQESGLFLEIFAHQSFETLTVTTSETRAAHLRNLASAISPGVYVTTFKAYGVRTPGGWS